MCGATPRCNALASVQTRVGGAAAPPARFLRHRPGTEQARGRHGADKRERAPHAARVIASWRPRAWRRHPGWAAHGRPAKRQSPPGSLRCRPPRTKRRAGLSFVAAVWPARCPRHWRRQQVEGRMWQSRKGPSLFATSATSCPGRLSCHPSPTSKNRKHCIPPSLFMQPMPRLQAGRERDGEVAAERGRYDGAVRLRARELARSRHRWRHAEPAARLSHLRRQLLRIKSWRSVGQGSGGETSVPSCRRRGRVASRRRRGPC